MKYVVTFIVTLVLNLSFAQTDVIITGQIQDQSTEKALPFSNISVMSKENKIITGAISDEQGIFILIKMMLIITLSYSQMQKQVINSIIKILVMVSIRYMKTTMKLKPYELE